MDILINEFCVSQSTLDECNKIEHELTDIFYKIDRVKQFNQYKVLHAMQKNKLSEIHFNNSTGYGYGDIGRDIVDKIYSDVFDTQDALVRHQITSGTHAISLCLFGLLRPGDEMLCVTGNPYDTLNKIILGSNQGSLADFGITYRQVNFVQEEIIDFIGIKNTISANTKLVHIQRSKGYNWRRSISIDTIGEIIKYVKSINPCIITLVDNCYGEFVETKEPTQVGADVVVGSLIKNPGGGIAPCGAYIAGNIRYIEQIANRFTAPGLGKHVGATLGNNRLILQGLYMAPHVVAESLKGSVFCAAVMEKLGFEVSPLKQGERSDIIQGIKFKDPNILLDFCQEIQKSSPVDSFVSPEPWDMPGYNCSVVMAAGCFIQGASIELSADAPMREPYICYMQGGLVYEQVKLAIMRFMEHKKL